MPRWSKKDIARFARRNARIARAVRDGMAITEAADRFGLGFDAIQSICKRQGLRFGAGGNAGLYARSAARNKVVARAVRGGLSLPDAAAKFGLTPDRVYHICHQQGVTFGPGGEAGPAAEKARRLAELARAASKLTYRQLAAKFGLSYQGAIEACRRLGVRPPKEPVPRRARGLEARAALRPQAARLIAAAGTPRNRSIARLLLRTTLTLGEIGEACGVTRQRVHQVWARLCSSVA